MLSLPDPKRNLLLCYSITPNLPILPVSGDLAALERRHARSSRAIAARDAIAPAPPRWLKPKPRPSNQYAGHMATTAARDRRLTPQAKALLQILRARCGTGDRTATNKTTLADILGVSRRSIQRYVRELKLFGYIDTQVRRGATGLYVGLAIVITEKVLPCFRKAPWLAGWLAYSLCATGPETGAIPDRTKSSFKNHFIKKRCLDCGPEPRFHG